MKVIDVLNKVASGELNDGFKFVDDNGSEWIYLKNVNKLCEINFATDNNVNGINYNTERIFWIKNLNDEIEILEEPKEELEEIELIDIHYENGKCIFKIYGQSIDETIAIKVNELIANQNKIVRELKANKENE